MSRLFVIGNDIPRLKCVEWSEWQNHNLLDYQGVLIDCRRPSRIEGQVELSSLLSRFMQNGRSVFLILPEANDVPTSGLQIKILPCISLNLQAKSGKTLRNLL